MSRRWCPSPPLSPPSASSSPPTPPSPLPVSVGPGYRRYLFSPSPSPSPPFSPPSPRSSPETVPLLRRTTSAEPITEPSTFSLDKPWEGSPSPQHWSLKDCVKRLLLRCCCLCCPSLLHAHQEEKLSSSNAVELNARGINRQAPFGTRPSDATQFGLKRHTYHSTK